MLIDTHCHLDHLLSEQLHHEINSDNVYIIMGTSSANWSHLINLSLQYANIVPAIGLHPWFVNDTYELQLSQLEIILRNQSVSVLGEVGLDFSNSFLATKSQQLLAFERQLLLAQTFSLPVSLHVIKAHNEMLALLKQYSVTGVVHGLGTSVEIAKQYLDLGYKFGVNGVVVKENARRYHQLVKTFGMDSIVLETDYPNVLLPSQPTASLIDIYKVATKIAELTGLPESDVFRISNRNAITTFNLRNSFESTI